jgi:alcohol dehydrogenase class IV
MKFGIEHGIACALSLAKVMEINLPAIGEADELFNALGVCSAEELQEWLDKTTGDIIDLRLSSFGIGEKDIPQLVEMSFTLGRMDNNPVAITSDDVKDILISIL